MGTSPSDALFLQCRVDPSQQPLMIPQGNIIITIILLTTGFGLSKFKARMHALAGQNFHAPACRWVCGRYKACSLLHEARG